MSDDLSILEGMDPTVAAKIKEAQSKFAGMVKNSDLDMTASRRNRFEPLPSMDEEDDVDDFDGLSQANSDDYVPPQFRVSHIRKREEEDVDERRSQDSRGSRRSRHSNDDEPSKLDAEQEYQQRLRYVIEITSFAKDLQENVPSELKLMELPFDILKTKWALWDARYKREQVMFVARNLLAAFGSALGLGFNKCYKYLMNADFMDMTAWAEHWYVTCTVKRPGRANTFDTSLMLVVRRFDTILNATAGELTLFTHFVTDIQKFKRREDRARKDAERRMQEREDRMLDTVRSEVKQMFKEQHDALSTSSSSTPPQQERPVVLDNGGGNGDIETVMADLPFDDDELNHDDVVTQQQQQQQQEEEVVRQEVVPANFLDRDNKSDIFYPASVADDVVSQQESTAIKPKRGRPRLEKMIDLDSATSA